MDRADSGDYVMTTRVRQGRGRWSGGNAVEAREEGRAAYLAGKKVEYNLHVGEEARAWTVGWKSAKAEAEQASSMTQKAS